ncbi:MAG: hypothetical protein A2X37_00870 [Elusimicrobia bacterium GWA2_66_18]|nr:MAG: hypothetical protein A2X37_00870 [Elusimicrobia bacterium GWA2_66_18]
MDFTASVVVAGEQLLDALEDVGCHDSLMLARELLAGPLVGDEPDVKLAPKRSPHGVHVEGLAAV